MTKTVLVLNIITVMFVLVSGMVATHLLISLVSAKQDMARCEHDGGVACHIERDGLDYGAYAYGLEKIIGRGIK